MQECYEDSGNGDFHIGFDFGVDNLEITDVYILISRHTLGMQMDEMKTVKLRTRWVIPDDVKPQFSDNSVIQFAPPNQDADHFELAFFRMQPLPVMTDEMNEQERKKTLETMSTLEATCVARVILTPRQVSKLIAALTSSLNKFENIAKQKNV